MNRTAARGIAVVGMLMMWLLLAPAAEAVPPPSPVVTDPPALEFTVEESAQPIHFEGTVTGPLGPFDRLQISNFTVNPGDPPLRCDFLLSGSTSWACDSTTVEAIGDYELRVIWFAPDPPFGEASAPTVLTLHVIPDGGPPPPPPPPDNTNNPPANNPTSTPTPAFVAPLPPSWCRRPRSSRRSPRLSRHPNRRRRRCRCPPTTDRARRRRAGPWDPTDHPKEVLGIGIATFTLLTFIGPAGLALSSMTGMGPAAVAVGAAAAAATGESGEEGQRQGSQGQERQVRRRGIRIR